MDAVCDATHGEQSDPRRRWCLTATRRSAEVRIVRKSVLVFWVLALVAWAGAGCGSQSAGGRPDDAAVLDGAVLDAPVVVLDGAVLDGAVLDAMPDAAIDAMPDAAIDAMPDAAIDAMPDAAIDAMPD